MVDAAGITAVNDVPATSTAGDVPNATSKEEPAIISSFGLKRLHSKVVITHDSSLMPAEKLDNPPSINDGLEIDKERDIRMLGCELIQASSILLRLPQVAAATAQILYQRFYYCKSFVRYNFEHHAMACIYLASKIEESARRLRDVINVFNHLRQMRQVGRRGSKPLALDANYVALKNEVIKGERRVLKELGFCVHVKHPHKLVSNYLVVLLGQEGAQKIVQTAWNYMNDGLRTDVFLRFRAEDIACACIFLASCQLDIPMPVRWNELFDTSQEVMESIALTIRRLYVLYNTSRPSFSRTEKLIAELKERQKAAKAKLAGGSTPKVEQEETKGEKEKQQRREKKRGDDERKRRRGSREKRRERSREKVERRDHKDKREARDRRGASPKSRKRSSRRDSVEPTSSRSDSGSPRRKAKRDWDHKQRRAEQMVESSRLGAILPPRRNAQLTRSPTSPLRGHQRSKHRKNR